MLVLTFLFTFGLPTLDAFFPAWLPLHAGDAATAAVERGAAAPATDDDDAGRYASMKRVPIRGAIDPQVIDHAKTLLTLPMGTERIAIVQGKPYAFRLEQHYHPPGFAHGPNGWHKGVTVYELVDDGHAAASE